jgi:hypothetical protein
MERFRILPVILVLAAIAFVCIPSMSQGAQTIRNVDSPNPSHVHKAERRPMPFPPGSETSGPAASLEFRDPRFIQVAQMSPQDRDLAADAESAIEERAGFAGLEFNQGKWSYQQIVCPALSHHLFLQFTRNNGRGDVSVFSASIPRSGDGRVRIIPIVRRGYSLFSPAPVNALTISAFNHIRAEEHVDQTPEWLATGMCYAALAGAHPQIGPPEETAIQKLPAAPPGRLTIPLHGGAVIRFTDVAAASRPMEWTMTFNGKGKLLKATHSAAPKSGGKVIERKPSEAHGQLVQATDPASKAILIK